MNCFKKWAESSFSTSSAAIFSLHLSKIYVRMILVSFRDITLPVQCHVLRSMVQKIKVFWLPYFNPCPICFCNMTSNLTLDFTLLGAFYCTLSSDPVLYVTKRGGGKIRLIFLIKEYTALRLKLRIIWQIISHSTKSGYENKVIFTYSHGWCLFIFVTLLNICICSHFISFG